MDGISWILLVNFAFSLFVVCFMDASEGNFRQKVCWKAWPAVLLIANAVYWLMSMGYVVAL